MAFLERYLRAVEQGSAGESFYTDDAMLVEHPNKLAPAGVTRNLSAIRRASEGGQSIVQEQSFEIVSAIIEDDRAALQLIWQATFNVDVMGLPAGASMRARFAQFYWFRGGRIRRQETYDCFEPW